MNDIPRKRLYRSTKDKVIAGVAGGLAEYFDIDPVLVRLGFVLLGLANGSGLVIYIIMMIVVPTRSTESSEPLQRAQEAMEDAAEGIQKTVSEHRWGNWSQGRNAVGFLLISLGCLFLLKEFLPLDFLNWRMVWPLGLVGLGLMILWGSSRR